MERASSRVVVCGAEGAGKTSVIDSLALAGDRHTMVEISSGDETLERFATAAPGADVVVAVVDATRGISPRTWWQSHVALRLGVSHVVVAVNKIDGVANPADVLDHVERRFAQLARDVGGGSIAVVPLDALHGDNVREASSSMSWYGGPTVLECLNHRVSAVATTMNSAFTTVCADAFEATLVWTGAQPMLQGRSYVLQRGTKRVAATVAPLKYKVDGDTLQQLPAKILAGGDIGVCSLNLQHAIDFGGPDRGDLRAFELLDPLSDASLGVGLLHFELRRSQNVRWQPVDIDKGARSALLQHKPCVVWFTGLSGAGKSTIANLVERELHARGCHTYLLDGDNVRHGLNKDLGFTDADRVENIRRVAEVARLMVDAGLIVLVSFISPFRSERRMARALVNEGEFIEVFVDVPLDVAEARDPKGLYRKARRGELKNFTGLDSPYEPPERPEIRLDTSTMTVEEGAHTVLRALKRLQRVLVAE